MDVRRRSFVAVIGASLLAFPPRSPAATTPGSTTPAKSISGIVATSASPDALDVEATSAALDVEVQSNGGLRLESEAITARDLLYVGTATGRAAASAKRVSTPARPALETIAAFRPGGRVARRFGDAYVAITPGECARGPLFLDREYLEARVLYAPCDVSIQATAASRQLVIAVDGNVSLRGTRLNLDRPAQDLPLLRATGHLIIGGNTLRLSGPIHVSGDVSVEVNTLVHCEMIAQRIRIRATQLQVASCASLQESRDAEAAHAAAKTAILESHKPGPEDRLVTTDKGRESLVVDGVSARIDIPVLSQGSIQVNGVGARLTQRVESVGPALGRNGSTVKGTRVAGSSPKPPFSIEAFRPGGPIAKRLGKAYIAIDKNECLAGRAQFTVEPPPPGNTPAFLVYVPCIADVTMSGVRMVTIAAEEGADIRGTFVAVAPDLPAVVTGASGPVTINGSVGGAVVSTGLVTMSEVEGLFCAVFSSRLVVDGVRSRAVPCAAARKYLLA